MIFMALLMEDTKKLSVIEFIIFEQFTCLKSHVITHSGRNQSTQAIKNTRSKQKTTAQSVAITRVSPTNKQLSPILNHSIAFINLIFPATSDPQNPTETIWCFHSIQVTSNKSPTISIPIVLTLEIVVAFLETIRNHRRLTSVVLPFSD